MPLALHRASELLCKWLGGSKNNIIAAFRDAERNNALLQIGAVDSFLRERESATRQRCGNTESHVARFRAPDQAWEKERLGVVPGVNV